MPSPVLFSLAGLLFAAIAEASFDGNINYLSPSTRHPVLGIDVGQVERRSWKRGSVALEPSELSFTHGVASGDPWPGSVILWTRIAPSNESDASDITVTGAAPLYSHETSRFIDASPNPICVEWSVFTGNGTHGSDSLVASGEALTSSDIDYTVKVAMSPNCPFVTRAERFPLTCRLRLVGSSLLLSTATSSTSAAPTRRAPWVAQRQLPGPMTTSRR